MFQVFRCFKPKKAIDIKRFHETPLNRVPVFQVFQVFQKNALNMRTFVAKHGARTLLCKNLKMAGYLEMGTLPGDLESLTRL